MIDFIKIHKRLTALIIILLFLILLLSRYSLISVNVSGGNSDGGSYVFKLTRQGADEGSEIKSDSSEITRFVQKGNYEVLAKQEGKSSFELTHAKGFLKKSYVKAKLEAEKSRQFIGNNPGPCMYYANILYSYECTGQAVFNAHIPATDSLPTYVLSRGLEFFGSLEGLAKTKSGTIILGRPPIDEDVEPPHIAAILDEGLKLSRYTTLSDLNREKIYSIKPYADGFVVYDLDFSSVYKYSSLGSQPEKLEFKKPSDNELKPIYIDTRNDSLLMTYSNYEGGEDPDDPSAGRPKNSILVSGTDYKFEGRFDGYRISNASMCGDKLICLTSGRKLLVYDTSDQKAVLRYEVADVKSFLPLGDRILVVRTKEVLNLSLDDGSGYVDYSLGDYKFCGIQSSGKSYVLCAINNSEDKVAILVDDNTTDSDSIDKKVDKLSKSHGVLNVSIYGSFIYISPDLGPLEYRLDIDGYGYNPEKIKVVNARINETIDSLGIDRNKYTIKLIE